LPNDKFSIEVFKNNKGDQMPKNCSSKVVLANGNFYLITTATQQKEEERKDESKGRSTFKYKLALSKTVLIIH